MESSQLKAVLRSANPSVWSDVWRSLPYQGTAYAESSIDYQHAYFRGAGWQLIDASLVLLNDGRPCGLWPLTLGGAAGRFALTSVGAAVLAPVFTSGLSPRTVKKICSRCIALLQIVGDTQGETFTRVEQGPDPTQLVMGASEWHQQIMAAGATSTLKHDLYADLRPAMDYIRANFRKSFRPLINLGLRSWKVFLLNESNADTSVWDEFKRLHIDIAGRVTRNDETWSAQFSMICAGEAFVVGLREPSADRLVGGGFFQCTRDEALYAVAAYDRSMFDKPLGHAVQQVAIETMKAKGLSWYRIGERFYPQDQPPPTEKEVSISVFKQGFASHVLCRTEFRLPNKGVYRPISDRTRID